MTAASGAGGRGDPAGSPATAWAFFRRDPMMRTFLLLSALGIAGVTADNVIEVFLVRGELHASTTAYGLLGATWSLAMVAGSWLVARRTPADRGLVAVTVLLIAATGAVQALVSVLPSVTWMFPLFVVGGMVNGGLNTTAGVLLGRRAPAPIRGRVLALYAAVLNSAVVAGYVIGGLALRVTGPRQVYLITGLVAIIVAAMLAGPALWAARTPSPERRAADLAAVRA